MILARGGATKGPGLFDWCYLELATLDAEEFNDTNHGPWTRGLLSRRHINRDTGQSRRPGLGGGRQDSAYAAGGIRPGEIEDSFKTAKSECGFGHRETRS